MNEWMNAVQPRKTCHPLRSRAHIMKRVFKCEWRAPLHTSTAGKTDSQFHWRRWLCWKQELRTSRFPNAHPLFVHFLLQAPSLWVTGNGKILGASFPPRELEAIFCSCPPTQPVCRVLCVATVLRAFGWRPAFPFLLVSSCLTKQISCGFQNAMMRQRESHLSKACQVELPGFLLKNLKIPLLNLFLDLCYHHPFE